MTQKVSSNSIVSLNASKLTGPHSNATDGSNLTNINDGMIESASDPTTSSNPNSGLGTLWVNHTSGEMYCCTDATTNANVWTNVGAGTGDVINQGPTNATNGGSFPDINKNSSQTFTFSGATDPDGSISHYMVDQFSNGVLSVSSAEVTAGSAHTFNTGAVGSDTAVTFRVRAKDNNGVYSSGVTVSMNVTNTPLSAATGGNYIDTDGDYKVHIFTSSGTFTPSVANATFDYLVVASGGGGGAMEGAGGGAGGMSYVTGASLTTSGYSVTVGAPGGAGASGSASGPGYQGSSGSNSSISGSGLSVTMNGGGGGGGSWGSIHANGLNGGSGGGASGCAPVTRIPGNGTAGQGNNGGQGSNVFGNCGGGAGGGKGTVGGDGTGSRGGHGGTGGSTSILSTSISNNRSVGQVSSGTVYFAGGGGGGTVYGGPGNGGNAGLGGGLTGNSGTGSIAAANSGGGGGGGYNPAGSFNATTGGSGVVIIRYRYQ